MSAGCPTRDELQTVARDVRGCSDAYREAREARDLMVRAALAGGMTHAEIAEAIGVSRGRIAHIARGQ